MLQVRRSRLPAVAGIVWLSAGTLVASIGLPRLWQFGEDDRSMYLLTLAVYLVFHLLVFSPLVRKHTRRILTDARPLMPISACFDRRGYIVMGIMITGGLALRLSGLVPQGFIAFFYSGLGLALAVAGMRFILNGLLDAESPPVVDEEIR